jgi:DNA (cytosine-5)-methyltransferase 1|nr:MAG TPA: Cytosine specific methyltransferase [Caudoviricetes sp.]
MSNKLRVLSLFSGIGAFEKALSNIGINYELVGFSEVDKFAIKSYCAIHGVDESLNLGDITKINIDKLPKNIDLITHGSPCQSYSSVGRQKGGDKGSGTKSSLMWNSVEIIKQCRPKYVIWENVSNVLSKKHKHNFEQYMKDLESFGYTSYYKILNAKDYGIPQNRRRIYCISILGERKPYKFPEEIPLKLKLKDVLEENVDNKYNLMKTKDFYLRNSFKQEQKGNTFKFRPHVKNNASIAYTITTKAGSRMDDNYIIDVDLPLEYIEYTNKFLKKYNLLDKIEEITNHDIRRLTPLECFRLMGFSDEDFYKAQLAPTSDTQLYKQAGNSIVVNVVEEIFKKLFL